MKRISTILTMLLMVCMGAWAIDYVQGTQVTSADGIADGGKYVIRVNGGSYITESGTQYVAPIVQNSLTTNAVFTFHANGESWTVECEATGNYWGTLTGAATGTFASATASNAGSWTFTFNSNNIVLKSGDYYINRSSGVMHGYGSTIALQIYNVNAVDWTPSLANKYISVGEKVASFGTVTKGSDNSKWYILTQDRGGETPMYYAGTGSKLMRAEASTTAASLNGTSATTNAAYLIRFIAAANAGTYNIQFADGNWITNELKTAASKDDAGTYALYNCNDGSGSYFGWNLNSQSGSIVDNNGAGSTLSFWGSNVVSGTSGNNVWHLYPVTLPDAAYTITYILPNTSQAAVEVSHISGDAPSAPAAWTRDGVTFSYYGSYEGGVFSNPVETITEGATVYVDYSYTKSDILSESTSNLKWYRMAALSSGVRYDLYYDGEAPYRHRNQSSFDGSDGYFWAFVGNPFDGVKVYNKAVETSNTLIYNNDTNPIMGTDDGTTWYISISNDGIGFQYSQNRNKRWNDYNGGTGPLKYYSGESWYELTAYDDVNYSGLYTANIAPFITYCGNDYFKISSENANALSSLYTTYNNDSKIDVSEYQSLVTELANYIKWPTTGYYRIKNVLKESYLKAENASQLTVGGTDSDASSIVYLNGSAGTYTMQMQGGYVHAQSNYTSAIINSTSANLKFTVPIDDGEVAPGKAVIGHGETATDNLTVYGELNVAGQSPSVGKAAYWTVEPANSFAITLNSDGASTPTFYATTYLPFDITLEGASAYTLTKNGTELTPSEEMTTVAAGTPVLLVGSSNSATATIGAESATTSNTNSLSGTYVEQDFALTYDATAEYFLGVDNNNKVGFYHSGVKSKTENSTNYYTLAANRAYLSNGSSARGYAINWSDASSIQDMKSVEDMNSTVVYDLQGRRVENPQHGMYIRNGRVIVVK